MRPYCTVSFAILGAAIGLAAPKIPPERLYVLGLFTSCGAVIGFFFDLALFAYATFMTRDHQPTPPRRRWFQFRLRTLLIVVAVVAVPLAWIAKERGQSRHEQLLAKQLEEEGFIQVGLSGPYDLFEAFEADENQGWWRNLARQLLGERIIAVVAGNTEIQDAASLAVLTNLQYLDLSETSVSDLTPLANVGCLETVILDSTPITDLTPIAKLRNLKYLTFTDTGVRDVSPLAHLENLEGIFLYGTQVTNLAPLAGLKNLKSIWLDSTAITKEEVEALQNALPNCEIDQDPIP